MHYITSNQLQLLRKLSFVYEAVQVDHPWLYLYQYNATKYLKN